MTNLIVFAKCESKARDSNIQVEVKKPYNNIAQAFDSVDDCVLLNKLYQFVFTVNLLNSFGSYLTNR